MDLRKAVAGRWWLRVFGVIGVIFIVSLLVLSGALSKSEQLKNAPQSDLRPVLPGTGNESIQVSVATPVPPANSSPQAVATPTKACTYSRDFWLAHPEAWLTGNIVIGKYSYSQPVALDILKNTSPDTTTGLLQQFLSAVLNILKGVDPAPVQSTLLKSGDWLNENLSQIVLSEQQSAQAADFEKNLEDFNLGVTGPGACPGQPLAQQSVSTGSSDLSATVTTAPPVAGSFISLPSATPTLQSEIDHQSGAAATSTPTITPFGAPPMTPTPFLSGTNTSTPFPSSTSIPSATSTNTNTPTPWPTWTDTSTATYTPLPTSTSTRTPLPTITPTSTPTDTPLPTNTPLPTQTPLPTNTPKPTKTPRSTSTPTSLPPTPTNTPLPPPTDTPLPPPPTDTPIPPPTNTVLPALPTDTSVPPTSTALPQSASLPQLIDSLIEAIRILLI